MSGDIALRPRDMARFGLMYLNGGLWNGRRILPPEWMEVSATPYVPFPASENRYVSQGVVGYSYGWWVKSEEYGSGAYAAQGWGGQQIIVMPQLDMVVVFTGGSYWEAPALSPHQMMVRYVLPALA